MQDTAYVPKEEIVEEDFYIKQINTCCLAQYSYYIESEKEAIVIDPMREPNKYLEILKERGASLKYIFETHFHADFVSGHLELAKLTGAKIVYGPNSDADFDYHMAEDEECFKLGKIEIKALHTPGHTLESSCYLIIDSKTNPRAIFTGDTLFLGEVGRPDLASKTISERDLADMLYESVHTRIKPLPDNVIIFPGHGAGSACGKKISSGGSDLLGNQKKTNYVFNENLHKTEFIEILTTNLATPPQYFFYDVMLNKKGYENVDKILEKSKQELSLEEYKKLSADPEILTLDTREVDRVCEGFIPGSVLVTLTTNYASWVGTLFSPNQKFIIVCEKNKVEESITRLARIGYDKILGYIYFETWSIQSENLVEKIENVDIEGVLKDVIDQGKKVVDVREKGEWETTGVVSGSILSSLSKINDSIGELKIPNNEDLYLLCRSGQRTLIYASILKRNGVRNKMINLRGGIGKVLNGGFQFEKVVLK